MAPTAYLVRFGPDVFSHTAEGGPISLGEAWRWSYGVGGVTICDSRGRVVLANAGAMSTRWRARRLWRELPR